MLVSFPSRRGAAGFTLIEMMIAMVIGLIVVIAVIAFIVAIMRSNNQTIQATRLTQELRATMVVIAADLKRARSVSDPLAAATADTATGQIYYDLSSINTATAGCIQYGYQGQVDGLPTNFFRTVSVSGNRVLLATGSAAVPTIPVRPACGTGTQIGSDQVNITTLTFTAVNSRRFDVTLTGALAAANSDMGAVRRTITETVYVRSMSK